MTPPAPGAIRPLAARANLTAALDAGLLPAGCRQFIADHEAAFLTAPGSGHNHQYWTGGHADHVDELFAIAAAMHHVVDSQTLPASEGPLDRAETMAASERSRA
jgi:hypothetical protein